MSCMLQVRPPRHGPYLPPQCFNNDFFERLGIFFQEGVREGKQPSPAAAASLGRAPSVLWSNS